MRYALLLLALFFTAGLFAQNNQVKSSGVTYSNGVPTWTPVEKSGSELNVDTITGYLYQWHRTPGPTNVGAWKRLGQGIDTLTSTSAPAYTPTRNQSWFLVNGSNELYRYSGSGTSWDCMNCGLSSTVTTDQTLDGDGSFGDPLTIAQQSADDSQVLAWTGATWEPSWGNPTTFVTTSSTLTTATNELLVGTLSANITIGLPTCNAANDSKRFKIVRNGSDGFSLTIDPASTEAFYDGSATKTIYGNISVDCTCRFSGGTGVWFVDNL